MSLDVGLAVEGLDDLLGAADWTEEQEGRRVASEPFTPRGLHSRCKQAPVSLSRTEAAAAGSTGSLPRVGSDAKIAAALSDSKGGV
jgi:hypothetical protein